MVAGYEWFSPTRIVGLTAYTISVLGCVAGLENCRKSGVPGRLFVLLTGVQLVLLLDMAFDWRWKIHGFWVREALALGVYDQRRSPQVLALAVLSLAMVLAVVFCRFRRRVGVALALTGTLLSVGLWCCECISWHFVDQFLYHLAGKVMVVSLLWFSLAVVTCFGVWLADRSHPSL